MAKRRARLADLDIPELVPPKETLYEKLIRQAVDSLTGADKKEWPEIPVHEVQRAFMDSTAQARGFVGGRGAGKSFVGALDTLLRVKANRLYLVTNPTYRLLKDSTIRSYEEVAKKLGCFVKLNGQDNYMVVRTRDGGEATINFRSADRPETMGRGPNYSGWHGDEASICKEELPKLTLATLRGGGELGWMSLTFTPNGKGHWTYGWFYDRDGNPKPNTELFRAGTKQNTFLPPGFYDMVASRYVPGSTFARQELDGEFVDLSGLTFQHDWFQPWVKEVPREATRVRYWDKAAADAEKGEKGDWSAGVLMARTPDGLFWIEDVVRGQWGPFERNKIIKETARRDANKYDGEVRIYFEREGGSSGKTDAILSMMDLAEFPVYPDSPVGKGNKEVRSRALQAQAEARRVRIVDADWTAVLLDELVSFPKGEHDDQVDACSGAYNMLAMLTGNDTSGDLIAYPCAPESERTTVSPDGASNVVQPEMDLLEYLRIYAGEAKEDSGPRGWVSRWINRN